MILNLLINKKDEPVIPYLYTKFSGDEYARVRDKNFALILVQGDEPYYSEYYADDIDDFIEEVL